MFSVLLGNFTSPFNRFFPFFMLRDHITLAVLELVEGGELAKLQKKWWLDNGECGKDGSPKKVRNLFKF